MTDELMSYLLSWNGHGREYAKTHMPIRKDPEEMIETVREWDERMKDTDLLRRAKGWVLTNRTWQGKYVFLSHRAPTRGGMIREFIDASHIDVDTQAMLCGLTTEELDQFLIEFRPRNVRRSEQIQEKVELYVHKIMETKRVLDL